MKAILKYLIAIVVISSFVGCDNSSYEETQQVVKQLTEEELKAELKNKECSYAVDYLDGKLGNQPIYKNALSLKVKGMKISCDITNKATLATMKDIKISIKLISKTKAVILKQEFTVYDFIAPGGTISYKNEIQLSNQDYKDIADISWNIVDAKCK